MKQNPYDVDTSDIVIGYAGYEAGFYCFRVKLAEAAGMATIKLQMEISSWAFDAVNGRWHMGNDFPYSDHPPVKLTNPGKNDTFIIFERMADAVAFENKFEVTGITPKMLV
jgi:hypothetical protein